MDFNLPKVATGILGKVVDKVADTVKDGAEKIGEGVEAVGNAVESVAEAVTEAASGTMGGDESQIQAQMGGYGTARTSAGARTRSTLSL